MFPRCVTDCPPVGPISLPLSYCGGRPVAKVNRVNLDSERSGTHPLLSQVRARLLVLGFIFLMLACASGCSGVPSSNQTNTTGTKLVITGSITPNAAVGVVYSLTDQASGGTPSYTWSVSAGALPPGLDLAASSVTISGTPNQNGTYNFTLEATGRRFAHAKRNPE